jgi:hypothetical protein
MLIAAIAVRDRAGEQRPLRLVPPWAANRLARNGHHAWPAVLLGVPALLWLLGSPLPPSLAADLERFDVDHHAAVAQAFVREVPPGAIVSAQSPFVPHLSERQHVYQFPRVLDAEVVLLDEAGPIPAGDIAGGYADCFAALPRLGFDEVRHDDGISLWRKTRPAESVPEAPVACSGQHGRS